MKRIEKVLSCCSKNISEKIAMILHIIFSFYFAAVYMIFTLGLGTLSTFLSAVVLNYAYDDEHQSRRFFPRGCFGADLVSIRKDHSVCVNGNEIQETALCEASSVNIRKDNPHSLNFLTNKALVKRIDIACFWTFLGLISLLVVVCVAMVIESDV